MSTKAPSQTELFLHGAGRYLDALAAIAAFCGEVQSMCEEIYEHHATELAEQLGLDAADCVLHEESDPDERWAEVGIKRPAQRDSFFYLYLSWDEDELVDGVSVAVCLDLYHKRLREEIYERFRKERPACRVKRFDMYQLVLTQNLRDLTSARDVLGALVLEWLDYCKSIGGLKLRERNTP